MRFDKRYEAHRITIVGLFFDWCQGLPSVIDTCYYYNRSAVKDLAGILEEPEEKFSKYNESDAEQKLTSLIFREILSYIGECPA